MNQTTPTSIVFTNKARCRDCHRCLRVCPVKAIRMQNGQAYVVPERCIACGTCIRECPQGAKTYRRDLERAMRVVNDRRLTAVSVAPSFAGIFQAWERRRLASALRRLGFRHVSETSIGAALIARETAQVAEERGGVVIGTACPVVVSWFEAMAPEALGALAPVVSPMAAHARYLRQKLGRDIGIVFIGPCIGKKAEADRAEHQGLIDAVLTFEELEEWLKQAGIALNGCEESDFDEAAPPEAVLFPLAGGQARAGNLDTDLLSSRTLTTTGVDELSDVRRLLETPTSGGQACLIEPLFCRQGCINGPVCGRSGSLIERRHGLLEYAAELSRRAAWRFPDQVPSLQTAFTRHPAAGLREVSEDEVRAVLEKTGKGRLEDQLNCGACGYSSCRDKAVAVIQGMAEPEMCIPHMRRLAEQRTDRIIETSPNGIVICGERLEILHMNQAFRRMFLCSDAVLGKHISYLMDPEPFEQLVTGRQGPLEHTVRHDKYRLICHQIMYELPGERQFVGIFVNLTNTKASQEKLRELRSRTLLQAQEMLEHQISMAQHLAKYLGESTARGEQLVHSLMTLAQEGSASEPAPDALPKLSDEGPTGSDKNRV